MWIWGVFLIIGAASALLVGPGAIYAMWARRRWPANGQMMRTGPYQLHVRTSAGEGTGERTGEGHGSGDGGPGPDAAHDRGARDSVVLLHGAAANSLSLITPLAEHLCAHADVWAIDRPGHGHSRAHGLSRRDRLAGHAAATASFLRSQQLGPTVIVAHSYGAAVALRVALDYPSLVKGLVLLAPASTAYVGPVSWYNYAAAWPVIGRIVSHGLAPLFGPPRLRAAVTAAFSPDTPPQNYAQDVGAGLLFAPRAFHANALDLSRVNRELAVQQLRYPTISCPTAIIAGPDDTVVYTHRHAEALATQIPHARLCLLPASGHLPHHHAPELIGEHVRALLDEEPIQ